jgi:hypothetical protein
LAKGLLKNLLSNEKKFLVTRLAEQMLRSGLAETGFEIAEIKKCDNRVGKIIIHVRGGASLT